MVYGKSAADIRSTIDAITAEIKQVEASRPQTDDLQEMLAGLYQIRNFWRDELRRLQKTG
jgi:hypothetical protein